MRNKELEKKFLKLKELDLENRGLVFRIRKLEKELKMRKEDFEKIEERIKKLEYSNLQRRWPVEFHLGSSRREI